MEDKRVGQIIREMLLGVVLTLPFFLNKRYGWIDTTWVMVIFRILFSIGVPMAVIKAMSVVYRLLSFVMESAMFLHEFLYYLFYAIFLSAGVYAWRQYSEYMAWGYFWLEIAAYLISAVWFLMDVNTTKCSRRLQFIYQKLVAAFQIHDNYVLKYKDIMKDISQRKEQVLVQLEPLYPRKLFRDPLKELRKDIDISRADNYQQYIPIMPDECRGLHGLRYGSRIVYSYFNKVNKYVEDMKEDRAWMEQEIKLYDGEIEKLEHHLELIKMSDSIAQIEQIPMFEIDAETIQNGKQIYETEVEITKNSIGKVKEIWKLNKNINKLRRKHYER